MIRTAPIWLLVVVAAVVSSCHLYFEEDEPESAADGGIDPVPADAAASCELNVTVASDRLRQCLEMEDWESRGLCDVPLMRTMQGTCAACHSGGADGIQLNPSCQLTFLGFSLAENFEDLQTAETGADGCVTGFAPGKICSSELISPTHPPFVCPLEIRRALEQFLDASFARVTSGECGAQ